MKKLITALLVAAFAFTSSFALADKPMATKSDIAWMYVVVSEKGKITKGDNGYTLTIDRKNLTNMLMFSDRPARLTKQMTLKVFESKWKSKNNSFNTNPPNAAVVISGKVQTVQLVSINTSEEAIEFKLKSDGNKAIQATDEGPTIIFVDPEYLHPGVY